MKKRILAVLLALCLALALVPTFALAADTNGFEIVGGKLTKYTGPDGDVVIPEGVISIEADVFKERQITSVTFPNTLIQIGDEAFLGCNTLTSVTFPSSLVSIEGNAFRDCISLQTVTFPEGVKHLRYGVFINCISLKTVILPTSVTKIEKLAFDDENMSITDIYYAGTEAQWRAIDIDFMVNIGEWQSNYLLKIGNGANFHFNSTGPNDTHDPTPGTDPDPKPSTSPDPTPGTPSSDFVIENGKLTAYNGTSKVIVIPEGVTSIAGVGDGMTGVFQGREITSVTFPSTLNEIGAKAFERCTGLKNVDLSGTGLTYFGNSVFYYSDLETISLPASLKDISSFVFSGTKLTDVYFSGSQSQWDAISIGNYNNELKNATLHLGSSAATPTTPTTPDPAGVKVTGVTVSKTSLTMEPGQTETLTAAVAPATAENTAVTWTSNAPAVAAVTSDGRVTALAAGAAEITAKTDDGGFTAVCRVLVKGESKPDAVEVHFPRANVYNQGQFTDVPADQWYTDGVKQAFEFGLMKGVSGKKFNPQGNVTLAEAITMAARIHSIYTTGAENFTPSGKWYQVYLDYAFQNGIISYAYYNSDVNKNATRAQFAEIFAGSLPEEALAAMNDVEDGAIPDVPMTEAYASFVYKLYRAGILAGGDARGTFSPNSYITRQECAAIVSRMAESNSRVSFTLG